MSRFRFGSTAIRCAVMGWLIFLPSLLIAEPTIWFCPQDPVRRPSLGYGGSPQFMELFEPGAPWAESVKRVSVFKIYPQWINQGSEDDLRKVFSYLRGHGISLSTGVRRAYPLTGLRQRYHGRRFRGARTGTRGATHPQGWRRSKISRHGRAAVLFRIGARRPLFLDSG